MGEKNIVTESEKREGRERETERNGLMQNLARLLDDYFHRMFRENSRASIQVIPVNKLA